METSNHSSCEEVSPSKKSFDIYDCMDLFSVEETLGEENKW